VRVSGLAGLLPLGLLVALQPAAAQAVGLAAPQVITLQVSVEGVQGEVRDNVLSRLSIEQRRRDSDHSEPRIQRLHAQAEGEIRSALQPFGYYRPVVSGELTRSGSSWHARFRVEPGSAMRLSDVDVRLLGAGSGDAAFRNRAAAFPLRRGDVLRHDLYEEGKLELLTVAAERGYLEARFTSHRIAVDTASLQATLVLHLETGERHRFGPVTFEQTGFDEELLRGFVPFREGDAYATSQLLELQRSLVESGFFRGVDVRARPDRVEGFAVPVEVTLEPRPRSLYSVGAGYGTDTGPRASASWELRRLNRMGHRLTGEARASFARSGVSARYLVPTGSAGDQLALSVGFQDERPVTHTTQSLLLGASLNHRRGGWQEQLYLQLQQDWFEVGERRGATRTVLPGASWTRTRTNDPLHTARGSRLALDVRGTHSVLGSEIGFAQVTLRGKRIRPAHEGARLIVRGDLGFTAVDRFTSLPPTMRFFAGGDQSVRGYGYQALGATDAEGRLEGGRHLAVGSVEYERTLLGDWGAALFYDVGNAFNGAGDGLRHGVGAGIRWLSPVGQVRLDLASAVSEPGRPLRLHVVIGPDL
jgi:translocation and assembly module TamA